MGKVSPTGQYIDPDSGQNILEFHLYAPDLGLTAIVDIKIPQFKTDRKNNLCEAIAGLGAPSVLDPEKSNFSKISSNFKNLYVSDMLQKAAIEVNEKGTELVTVTEADVMVTLNPSQLLCDFHANRPFVYVIQEVSSGAIFFIGTFLGE